MGLAVLSLCSSMRIDRALSTGRGEGRVLIKDIANVSIKSPQHNNDKAITEPHIEMYAMQSAKLNHLNYLTFSEKLLG